MNFILLLVSLISILNGSWMIFDGNYVKKHGKYFGTEKPGPWSILVHKLGINPLKMGNIFITYGFIWIIGLFLLILIHNSLIWSLFLIISLITLWYIPIGSIISLINIIALIVSYTNFVF